MRLLKQERRKQPGQQWLKQILKPAMNPFFLLLSSSSAPQVWGCCTCISLTGVSPVPPASTKAQSLHSSQAASAADPLWLREKWYSPASESACCYGNTSHLTCSHPTLLPMSRRRWKKRELQKQQGGWRRNRAKEEENNIFTVFKQTSNQACALVTASDWWLKRPINILLCYYHAHNDLHRTELTTCSA